MIYRFGNYSEYWQILLLYKNGDGNGITPVMPAFWTKFMVAETQMLAGNVVGAKTTVFEGIIMSIDKVINFAPSTDRFDWIFGTATGGPAIALESDYIDWFNLGLSDDWDAATTAGKWDIPCYAIFCCVLL